MRYVLLMALLGLCIAAPVAARADTAQPPGGQPAPAPGVALPAFIEARLLPPIDGWVVSPGQWLAVGAGAVVGVMVVEILLPTRLIYVAGGIAGGYLADVWYSGRQLDIHTTP